MAANDVIRFSGETMEDLQTRLRTLQKKLSAETGSLQRLAGAIDALFGANVPVSVKLPGQSAANDVQSAITACIRALALCTDESVRICSAAGRVSSLFEQNEARLTASISGEENGSTGKEALSGGESPSEAAAADGSWLDWLRENYPELAQFFELLASMGADGEKLLQFISSLLKVLFGKDLPTDLLTLFSKPAKDVLSSSFGKALLGPLTALDVVSFIASIGADLASDISEGLPADRIICNVIANTLVSAVTTVGGAVGGDLLAKALGTAIAAIPVPGLQAVGPVVSAVASPLLQIAVTHGIDAFMNLKIGDQTVTEYIQDFVYNAYQGCVEGVQVAKEVFSTLADYAQSGAEMIYDGLQSAGEAIADGLDAMHDAAEDAFRAAQDFISDGAAFVQDSISWLIA